jgi:hypothetical protein
LLQPANQAGAGAGERRRDRNGGEGSQGAPAVSFGVVFRVWRFQTETAKVVAGNSDTVFAGNKNDISAVYRALCKMPMQVY